MNPTKTTARRAGALYFLFMILAIYGEFLFPKFMVPGDPTATASRINAQIGARGRRAAGFGVVAGIASSSSF